jgi:OmpA-OmpF porin, OOP family
MGMGAKAHLKYNLNPSLGLRLSANYLSLKGDDKNFDSPEWRNKRGFAFSNNVIEAGLAFEYDLMGKKRAKNEQFNKKWSPYLLGGVGLAIHDPKPTFNEPNIVTNASLISEDKVSIGQMTTVTIPIGVGFRYRINNNWAVAAEFTSSIATSDYIDGISQAGNPNKNDWYALSSLSIVKKFGTKQAKTVNKNKYNEKSGSDR